MSNTRRAHLPDQAHRARAHRRRKARARLDAGDKTTKQTRVNDKAALRKEFS